MKGRNDQREAQNERIRDGGKRRRREGKTRAEY